MISSCARHCARASASRSPTHTAVVNKWLDMPDARLVLGCALSGSLVIRVEIPQGGLREDGDVIGIDVGIAKLLATSDGEIFGANLARRLLGQP